MARVKDNANRTACMTNLHQIALAVQMFKTDNRRYPDILGSRALAPGDMFENRKDDYLFPEYTKSSIKVFHCPSSKTANTVDTATYYRVPGDANSEVTVFAYSSYECFVTGAVSGSPAQYSESAGTAEPHYRPNWAPSTSAIAGSGLLPYPVGTGDTAALQQNDYERQLKWRNPPGDTVVTWCAYHESRTGASVDMWNGVAQVVFLDGSTDAIPAKEFEKCKWRARPKKS